MEDSVSVSNTTGFLSRIINSILGVLVGIVLFFGSFAMLYWNEGRQQSFEIYKNATEVSNTSPNSANDGKLIVTKGKLSTDGKIDDNLFLNKSDYLVISRKVEMYSWKEKSESSSTSNTGGSETTTTKYSYSKEWTNFPQDSSSFKDNQNNAHTNPEKKYEDSKVFAPNAKLGGFSLALNDITLPNLEKLQLSSTLIPNITPAISITPTITPSITSSISPVAENITVSNSDFIFYGKGNLDLPQVGDLRISYSVLPNNSNLTVFAKQNGNTLETYEEKGVKVFRLFSGTKDEALNQVKTEDATLLWILRVVGFLMMWFGLLLILGPIATVSDFFPILGKVTGFILSAITFPIALVLSIITILISIILHNIFAMILIGSMVIVLIGFVFYRKSNLKKK